MPLFAHLESQPSSRSLGPSQAALLAYHSDLGEDHPSLQPVLGAPAQQPVLRLTFRDPDGQVQAGSFTASWRPYIGNARADQRKQRIWNSTAAWYREMGCELLTLEIVHTYPEHLG